MQRHDFHDFMANVKEAIAKEYSQIRKRAFEDPGTAGDQVEESWAEFLRNWLPATYPVVTKGRLLFPDGFASPQVDVLVLSPSYPLQLRHQKYYFVGGVLAAFECKLTLKKDHIRKAFRTAAEIKKRRPSKGQTPYQELVRSPIFGVLAHSHVWTGPKSSFKVYDRIEELQVEFAQHPRELLDILCVADTATYTLGKFIDIGEHISPDIKGEFAEVGLEEAVSSMYTIQDEEDPNGEFDPSQKGNILAALLFWTIRNLAYEDVSIRSWSDHLGEVGSYGGIGRPIFWKTDVLSDEVRNTLRKSGFDEDPWSFWTESI